MEVDVAGNCARMGSVSANGRHRWEALLIALLVDRGGTPLHRLELLHAMRHSGQVAMLDRTGFRRLFLGAGALVDTLLGPGSFHNRLRHDPRRLTVGPWALVLGPGEQWTIKWGTAKPAALPDLALQQSAAPAALAAKRVAVDHHAGASARVLELLFRSDALAAAGRFKDAIEQVRAAELVDGLSPEMAGILGLRLARLFKRTGRYDECAECATRVARKARERGFADPAQRWLAELLLRRQRYESAPAAFDSVERDLAGSALAPLPDLRGAGDLSDLAADVWHRKALRALRLGHKQQAASALHNAWALQNDAMYWAASLRSHDHCERFAFKMGLIQAALFEVGDAEALRHAVRCYTLGLQLSDDFMVGNDSVWEYICLGALWLDHPAHRAEIEQALALGQASISNAAFFEQAAVRARQVGEPRQIAICLVNQWRFAAEVDQGPKAPATRQQARDELLALLRCAPQLVETLKHDSPAILAKILEAR